jgi:hypothetical protein
MSLCWLQEPLFYYCKIQPYLSIYLSIYPCCFHLQNRASVKRFVPLQILNLRQSIGLLGWESSPTQGRYLQKQNKSIHTSMVWVGFEPKIPAFEREKEFHALVRAAPVIDSLMAGLYKTITWNKKVITVYQFHGKYFLTWCKGCHGRREGKSSHNISTPGFFKRSKMKEIINIEDIINTN